VSKTGYFSDPVFPFYDTVLVKALGPCRSLASWLVMVVGMGRWPWRFVAAVGVCGPRPDCCQHRCQIHAVQFGVLRQGWAGNQIRQLRGVCSHSQAGQSVLLSGMSFKII